MSAEDVTCTERTSLLHHHVNDPNSVPPTNSSLITNNEFNRIEDLARQFLTQFGSFYLKIYGAATLDCSLDESDTSSSQWKLDRRDYDSIPPRDSLTRSYVKVKQGGGPGNFSEWQRLFIVERLDFALDVYGSEQEFQNRRTPLYTIQPAGYSVILNTHEHYTAVLLERGNRLGLTEKDITRLTTEFTKDLLALSHAHRTNYVFKMDKSSSGCCERFCTRMRNLCCCCCCRSSYKQSSDSEEEHRSAATQEDQPDSADVAVNSDVITKQKLIDVMKKCVQKARTRIKESISSKAFEKTCREFPESELQMWKKPQGDGTEEEILVDFLMERCLSEFDDTVPSDQRSSTKTRISAWYTTRTSMQALLRSVVDEEWAVTQVSVKVMLDRIRSQVRDHVTDILEVRRQIESFLGGTLSDHLASLLKTRVSPFIEPLLTCLEKLIKTKIWHCRAILSEQVRVPELPEDRVERNAVLDKIPRDESNMRRLQDPLMLSALNESLHELKQVERGDDCLKVLSVDNLGIQADKSILELMDSVVFTLEQRLDDEDQPESLRYLFDILMLYDEDALLLVYRYIKEIVQPLLFSNILKDSITSSQSILGRMTEISKEFEDIINVDHYYQISLNSLVGQLIDNALSARGYSPQKRL